MLMPGRKFSSDKYRYGFNGKENDNEVKGDGNQQDYGMRVYDGRIGKFLSVDPLYKDYPWNSTYAFAENDIIRSIDLDGLERYFTADGKMLGKYGTSQEMRIIKQEYLSLLQKNKVNIHNLLSTKPKPE